MMQLRARVWPVLLGVEPAAISRDEYMQWAHGRHPDSSVVDVDVQRSLWSYTEGMRSTLCQLNPAECDQVLLGIFQRWLVLLPGVHSQADIHFWKASHDCPSRRVVMRCRMGR